MKNLVYVFLIGIGVAITSHQVAAQSAPMTAGVSVKLAETTSAVPYPDADVPASWVVAVTADGHLFFGTKPVTPESLLQLMQSAPRSQTAKLYVKADDRAPFQSIKQVLNAAHAASFETAVLLTSQSEAGQMTTTSPMGLEIRLGSPNSPAVDVFLRPTNRSTTEMTINKQALPFSRLPVLKDVLQKQSAKLVVLDAAGTLQFDPFVKVIDFAHSISAEVTVPVTGN